MLPLEPRVWPLTAALATDGQLVIGGTFAKDLAHTYGTPLFVYSRTELERQFKAYQERLHGRPHLICYEIGRAHV